MITIGGASIPVIDAHVHIFPEEIGKARGEWLLRDRWFHDLYENPNAKLASADDLIESMDLAGIDRSIVCGFPWNDDAHCRFHNDYMLDAVARYPDRLSWLGTVSPSNGGAQTAEACLTAGASGIGELNADAQDFLWSNSRALEPLHEVLTSFDRPLMVHTSEPLGHEYPGKGKATPDQILALAEAFPRLKIVAAHWGGGLPFFELMPEVRRALTGVFYDSAATTYLYEHSVFQHVIDICGAEKVVFASDYPVLRQDKLIARVIKTTLIRPGDLEHVMSGNAERIYGIGTAQ